MEFFNKKEEVMDLVLTRKGREKLAASKFAPDHYEFTDDGVIYDPNYITSSYQPNVVSQNGNFGRIKDALIFKNQTGYRGVRRYPGFDPQEIKVLKPIESVGHFSSEPNSKYKPAWQIRFIDGSITGSGGKSTDPSPPIVFTAPEWENTASYDTNKFADAFVGRTTEKIPQIDIKCQYTLATEVGIDEDFETTLILNDFLDEETFFKTPTEDSYILLRKDSDDFTIEIVEENVPSTKENFTLEIFKYEYKAKDGTQAVAGLEKYYFEDSELGNDSVEHYFNVLTDELALEKTQIEFISEDEIKESLFVTEDECAEPEPVAPQTADASPGLVSVTEAAGAGSKGSKCTKGGDCGKGLSCLGMAGGMAPGLKPCGDPTITEGCKCY